MVSTLHLNLAVRVLFRLLVCLLFSFLFLLVLALNLAFSCTTYSLVSIAAHSMNNLVFNEKICNLISLNMRGIRDQSTCKRRSIFSFLKDQKALFYFLRETFSVVEDEPIWKKEWGGKMFFSHGSHHSKGVCILIDPSMKENLQYSFSDNEGRIALFTVSFKIIKLSLCNMNVCR